LLSSVMMLAVALGLVPSEQEAIKRGRLRQCEAMAVAGSVAAARHDEVGLEATLKGIATRDHDIISAAVRTADDKVIAFVGEHTETWDDDASGDSHVTVPIYNDQTKWGTVDVRFRKIS